MSFRPVSHSTSQDMRYQSVPGIPDALDRDRDVVMRMSREPQGNSKSVHVREILAGYTLKLSRLAKKPKRRVRQPFLKLGTLPEITLANELYYLIKYTVIAIVAAVVLNLTTGCGWTGFVDLPCRDRSYRLLVTLGLWPAIDLVFKLFIAGFRIMNVVYRDSVYVVVMMHGALSRTVYAVALLIVWWDYRGVWPRRLNWCYFSYCIFRLGNDYFLLRCVREFMWVPFLVRVQKNIFSQYMLHLLCDYSVGKIIDEKDIHLAVHFADVGERHDAHRSMFATARAVNFIPSDEDDPADDDHLGWALYQRLLTREEAKGSPRITFATLVRAAGGEVAERARELFGPFKEDGTLDRQTFCDNVKEIQKSKVDLAAGLKDYEGIVKRLAEAVKLMSHVLLLFVWMSLAGKDITKIVTALLSLFLGFSFMFSSSASRYFEGLAFVVGFRAFDVGDRVLFTDDSGVENNYVVSNMAILTTAFLRSDGAHCMISNAFLATRCIRNLNRSEPMVSTVNVLVSSDTSPLQIFELRRLLSEAVDNSDGIFLEGSSTVNEDSLKYGTGLELTCSARHAQNWQDNGLRYRGRTLLIASLRKACGDLEIGYRLPSATFNFETPPSVQVSSSQA